MKDENVWGGILNPLCDGVNHTRQLAEGLIYNSLSLIFPGFVLASVGVLICLRNTKCPFCAETIEKKAKVCKFCNKDLLEPVPN